MSKLKLIKKIFLEAFQWSAFAAPIFATGQRMAMKECSLVIGCDSADNARYWVLIAGIIAYVAGITLVVWLPVKIFIVWKKVFRPHEGLWFPGNLLYVFFSAVPCAVFVLIAHENCGSYYRDDVDCFEYFRGAPVETLIIMLVVTDWSEKLRYIRLRSPHDTMRTNKYTSADWDGRGAGHTTPENSSTNHDERALGGSRRSSISHHSLLHRSVRNGTMRQRVARSLKWTDARPENLLRDLMLAYDAYLMLSLSLLKSQSGTSVFETDWIYSIYIITVISFLPYAFSPNSDMRSSMTILLQDIPYLILRISIFAAFGTELVLNTSVLFLLKNFFVTFAFIYFNIVLPKYNEKNQKNMYKLGELPAVTESSGNNTRVDASRYELEHGDHNQYLPEEMGITNPGFSGGEQLHTNFERSHSTRSRNQQASYWSESPYHTQEDMEAQYPSRHTAGFQEPYTARIENTLPITHTENYQEFSDEDVENEDLPPVSQKPPEEKKQSIDYESLHNPKSFLYNQKRPDIFDIKFEDSPQSSDSAKVEQANRASTKSAKGAGKEIKTSYIQSDPSNTTEMPKTSVNSHEPVYAQVNRSTTNSRRKAPPPPSKPTLKILKTTRDQNEVDVDLPPPPPDMMTDQKTTIPNGHISHSGSSNHKQVKDNNTMLNQELAQQLAMEAVSAIDDAADYVSKIGEDWSASTTPKSSQGTKQTSSRPLSTQNLDDDEFDIRL